MKRIIISAGVFIALCVSVTFLLNITNKSNQVAKANDKDNHVVATNSYVVKEYRNRISVFEVDKDEPFKITEVVVDDLPEGDKKLLKQGIKVVGFEELSKILEDYEC